MIPYYLDIVLRTCRLLGTIRSVIVQTEQLYDFIDNSTGLEEILDAGLEL